MVEDIPSVASLLRNSHQVTHFKPSRGWIETPDGRFYKPKPEKVKFIKDEIKPVIFGDVKKNKFIWSLFNLFK